MGSLLETAHVTELFLQQQDLEGLLPFSEQDDAERRRSVSEYLYEVAVEEAAALDELFGGVRYSG